MSPPRREVSSPTEDFTPASAIAGEAAAARPLDASHNFRGYDIIQILGHGGMGIVYQAYDQKRRRMVALKTLKSVHPAALYAFKQEFRSLADVAHCNLVHYFELVAAEPQWFLTMELVAGIDFFKYIHGGAGVPNRDTLFDASSHDGSLPTEMAPAGVERPAAPLPPKLDRLRAAFRQLTSGVAAIHRMGKLHRDLKPSNVLVANDGRVVILDFGLATELDSGGHHQSKEHRIVGTIAYMAPEQAAARAVSRASDWYSVGVMLYESLTGHCPFEGDRLQILNDKQSRDPPPPQSIDPQTPPDLNALCMALLRREPGERPAGDEVTRIFGGERENELPLGKPPGPHAAFIGRERQLAEINEAYRESRRGRPICMLVHGRSGFGKSLLAQHFLDDLASHDEAVLLTGKCYERESVPFKALDSLIDSLSRYLQKRSRLEVEVLLPREIHLLARVFPVLGRVDAVAAAPGSDVAIVDPHEARRRAFAALRQLLARLADRRPLVLFVDDLQWGDAESAEALAELLRPPEAPSLLFLGSYRSEEKATSVCLGKLFSAWEAPAAADMLRSVAIEPLTGEESRRLASALLASSHPAAQSQAEAVAHESRGNPFFVQVLVQRLLAHDQVASERLGATNLTLDQVLWERVQTLPLEERHLLEIIAVSGQPLPQAQAAVAAGLRDNQPASLARLRFERLIRSAGPTEREEVETYHDRVRETILSRMTPADRQNHHRSLALVIEGEGEPATPAQSPFAARRLHDLAYHFDAAGEGGRALPYALAAAEQARARHALGIAEQQFRIAERGVTAADGATRFRIAEGLGEVLMLRGDYENARGQFEAASSLAPSALQQAQVEGKLGEVAFKRGDLPASGAAIERALRLLGKRVPRSRWVFGPLACWEGAIQSLHTILPKAFLARRSLDGAEAELTAIRLYSRLAYAYWFCRGRIPCFWAHLRDMNLAERYPPTAELAQAYSEHAPAMSMIGWFDRGIAYAEKSLAIRRSLGDAWGQGQSLHFYGVVLYAASRFEECIATSRDACRLLEQTGDPWELNSSRYQVAHSLYRLGDLAGAASEAWRFHQAAVELGDAQGTAMSLDIWTLASRGNAPANIIRIELERPTDDEQRNAQVMIAEAIRLLAVDSVRAAAELLDEAVKRVRKAGITNTFVAPVYAWRVTALRRQAELAAEHSRERKSLLRRAAAASRQALRVARLFQNDLPHALREAALVAALRGRARQARRLLRKSLDVAEKQGAQFELAQTLEARDKTGKLEQ